MGSTTKALRSCSGENSASAELFWRGSAESALHTLLVLRTNRDRILGVGDRGLVGVDPDEEAEGDVTPELADLGVTHPGLQGHRGVVGRSMATLLFDIR